MPRKRFTSEQIITKLREAEVRLSKGQTVAQACKPLDVTEQPYSRWRNEDGGLSVTQAKRLKTLEQENARPLYAGTATPSSGPGGGLLMASLSTSR